MENKCFTFDSFQILVHQIMMYMVVIGKISDDLTIFALERLLGVSLDLQFTTDSPLSATTIAKLEKICKHYSICLIIFDVDVNHVRSSTRSWALGDETHSTLVMERDGNKFQQITDNNDFNELFTQYAEMLAAATSSLNSEFAAENPELKAAVDLEVDEIQKQIAALKDYVRAL